MKKKRTCQTICSLPWKLIFARSRGAIVVLASAPKRKRRKETKILLCLFFLLTCTRTGDEGGENLLRIGELNLSTLNLTKKSHGLYNFEDILMQHFKE